MTFRKLRSVDIDLNGTSLIANNTILDISSLIENYESTLSELLDTHAPEKRRIIILRPHAPWYNDSINVEKKKVRNARDGNVNGEQHVSATIGNCM